MAPMREAWHGTVNGYANHGCKCDGCRAAWATYYRERRADQREAARTAGMRMERGKLRAASA